MKQWPTVYTDDRLLQLIELDIGMTSKLLSHLSYLLLALLTYMYMYTELKHAVVSSINNYSHSPVVGSSMDSSLAKPRFNNIGLDTECSHGLRDAVTMRWLKINH